MCTGFDLANTAATGLRDRLRRVCSKVKEHPAFEFDSRVVQPLQLWLGNRLRDPIAHGRPVRRNDCKKHAVVVVFTDLVVRALTAPIEVVYINDKSELATVWRP